MHRVSSFSSLSSMEHFFSSDDPHVTFLSRLRFAFRWRTVNLSLSAAQLFFLLLLLCFVADPPLDPVLPPPAPCVSNLPEKLIICHIASALRHTPNRSRAVSKVLVESLNRALDAFGFGLRVWRTDALTEPSWCASVLLVRSSGTLHRQLPIQSDSHQWDNAATLFLLGACKVTQWLSVRIYFIIFLPFLCASFFGVDLKALAQMHCFRNENKMYLLWPRRLLKTGYKHLELPWCISFTTKGQHAVLF